MTPSWYDVLGVEPTADTEEIRQAWRSAIDGLEPGRRFRALNDAAEVLLDGDRRAAHDADLARDAGIEPDAEAVAADHRETTADAPAPPYAAAARGWAPPVWLLAGMAILVGVLAGLSAWQLSIPSDAAVRSATRAAQADAERAAVAVLSFDYRDLDASQAAAAAYLTKDYRTTDYEPLFELIRQNAPSTRTVVNVEVVASGIVRSGDDRVSVLVFVNRPTLRADRPEPEVFRDQVTMEMVQVGEEWLVDALVSTPVAP